MSEQSPPQVDPWSVILPGSYPPGSAGAIIAGNLDAAISTRSTYSGGPVQSVLSPVTVGSCQDKSGYRLAADGFDEIVIEPGINARQSLSPILAGIAGDLSGAGSGTIVIKAGGNSATRIIATTDDSGNRSSVSLNLPL
ncbi:MAG: hypothetical protein SFX72_19670 [Isosphaeraceae bacterium]|nr:hypothetical protein [Isosphaeraceae bacterium]